MSDKVEIQVVTGSEWHTSYGAYGKVLIGDGGGKMVPHFRTSKSEADWDKAEKIGHGGKHGQWVPAFVELDEGELIYTEGARTYKGRSESKARGWFRASSEADEVEVSAPGYGDNCLSLKGRLERLSYQEMKDLGLSPTIRSSKHLNVEVAE